MSPGRRSPFEELERFLDRMGREIDIEDWPTRTTVAVDVADHGDRYVVTADLPGYEKDDIDLRLATGTLELAAGRTTETAEEDVDYLRRERRQESVTRRVALPDAVDEEGIVASYAHGVLTVELPKREADGGTRIDVE